MPNKPKMKNAVFLGRTHDIDGNDSILLAVRQDAFVELADAPWPGVLVAPSEARVLAHRLLLFAAEIEVGAAPPDGSSDS